MRTRSELVATFFVVLFALCTTGSARAAPGDLDPAFGHAGLSVFPNNDWTNVVRSIVIDSADRIVVASMCQRPSTAIPPFAGICHSRRLSDGSADVIFAGAGARGYGVGYLSQHVPVQLDASERILTLAVCFDNASSSNLPCLIRYSRDGFTDTSFGFGNSGSKVIALVDGAVDRVAALKALPSGQTIVASYCTVNGTDRFCVARFDSDGNRLVSYAVAESVVARNTFAGGRIPPVIVSTSSAGDLFVVGTCETPNVYKGCAVKYLSSGQIDTSYGVNGVALVEMPNASNFYVRSSLITSSGRLQIGGTCVGSADYDFCVGQILAHGQPDVGFANLGRLVVSAGTSGDDTLVALVAQTNNKTLLVGGCSNSSPTLPNGVCAIRIDEVGTLDSSYGIGGKTINAFSLTSVAEGGPVAATSDQFGRVIVAGECKPSIADPWKICLARLKGGPYDPTTCALNADANNRVAGNDAMLAVRYLLGYTGSALTDGALGANPGRTGAQIESHLAQLKTEGKLDVDGDGESLAMTDGLLILRAMLGLSGDALTQGALGRPSAAFPTLRTSQQILQWIESTHGVACLP